MSWKTHDAVVHLREAEMHMLDAIDLLSSAIIDDDGSLSGPYAQRAIAARTAAQAYDVAAQARRMVMRLCVVDNG